MYSNTKNIHKWTTMRTCAKLVADSTLESVYYLDSDEYLQWESIEDFLHKAGVTTIRIDSASI